MLINSCLILSSIRTPDPGTKVQRDRGTKQTNFSYLSLCPSLSLRLCAFVPVCLVLAYCIPHQHEGTDHDVQQLAERHVSNESAGQYGVKVPNVAIHADKGSRAKQHSTNSVSRESITRA